MVKSVFWTVCATYDAVLDNFIQYLFGLCAAVSTQFSISAPAID